MLRMRTILRPWLWLVFLAAFASAAAEHRDGTPENVNTPHTDQAGQGDTPTPKPPAEVPLPTAAATIPGLRSGARVAVIPIEGMIYDFTLESLQRRVERARQLGATVIVLELNTPGGVVTSALKISKYIKSLDLPTLAWVNNEAYSAGILIASACDAIVMAPASATGDCAPIVPGKDLAPTERAKALSPILTEFRDSAQQNGYEYALFHAMCVLGIEVYKVQNRATGEIRLVNQADYAVMVEGADPNNVGASSDWVHRIFGSFTGSPKSYVGAPSVRVATDNDRGQWNLLKKVHDGQTLLTLTQAEAIDLGLAKALIPNEAELKQFLGAASILNVKLTWSEQLAAFLTNPIVRVVLVIALLLGGYVEFQAPGVGMGGIIAMIALAGLLGGPFLAGLAQVWHILLFLTGFILLMVEIFVIPGFGVAGISGLILMFAGLALSVVPSGGGILPPQEMWGMLQESVLWLLLGLIFSFVGFVFLTRHFGSVPLFNKLVLREPERAFPNEMPGAMPPVSGDDAVGAGRIRPGQTGHVITKLRPIGRAEIEGQPTDVICEGQWLEIGTPVRVISVQGNRIVVEHDDPSDTD